MDNKKNNRSTTCLGSLLICIGAIFVAIHSIPALAVPGDTGSVDVTELSIEELLDVKVTTASRFPQKTIEAPASVSIITAADIKAYGYRTLADILNSMRGIYISYDRSYQYVGVRGFNRPGDFNSRILLQVDGYRVNDANYDTASIGQEFFLDVDLIDRVEMVRGPGSSVYGSNAVFGVVNIITKHGRDFKGMEASAAAASFGTVDGRLTYGQQLQNGAELLLSATRDHSDGQDLFYPAFNSTAHNLDSDNAKRVYGKLTYGGFTLAGAWSERIKRIPTASFGAIFNDPRMQYTDSQAMLDLAYYGELNERWDVSGRLYYGSYSYDASIPYDLPPVTLNEDIGNSEWWGGEAKLVGEFERHKLVLGLEYQDNFRQDLINYDISPFLTYEDVKKNSTRNALYIQDEVTLGHGFLLNAGLRYDDYSTIGETLNPRLGLIYSPHAGTAFKILYGTAFRAPNNYEQYGAGAQSKANPGLQPEEITSYELVVEHQLQPNFRLTANAYLNEISGLINQVTNPSDGLLIFRNTGEATAKGVELEAERVWSGDIRLRASYAWQITQYDTGTELENSPRHLAKFNFSTPLFDNALRAGVELQYMSSRKTLAGASTNDHLITNLTLLNHTLVKKLEISASIYNLFDTHYADPARPEHVQDVIPQDERSFRLKFDYRF